MQTRPVILGNTVDFFRDGDTTTSTAITATRARTSNVATLTTGSAHGLSTGAVVTISGVGGTGYDLSSVPVTVIDTVTFSYPSTGSNESSTADTGGTVTSIAGRLVLPIDADPSWINAGKTIQVDVEKKQTEDQVFAPNPGRIELYDVIETKRILGYDWTSEEITPFAMEALFGTTEKLSSSSTNYTNLTGATKKGWVRLKQYDQSNNLTNTAYSYGYLKVNGKVSFQDKHVTIPFHLDQLLSSLNKGVLGA